VGRRRHLCLTEIIGREQRGRKPAEPHTPKASQACPTPARLLMHNDRFGAGDVVQDTEQFVLSRLIMVVNDDGRTSG
jgi:hypothetical protein